MADVSSLPTTQRAYTLRLRGATDGDLAWRDALWATHEAVNKGAKAFGDWLLTLRGGLDHRLADEAPPDQRKDRRILLALSWLSVEDARGAPDEFEVQRDDVIDTLAAILRRREVSSDETGEWLNDCGPSLRAEIREDATWVNRSAAFDEFARRTGAPIDRQYSARIVVTFLEPKGPYFVIPSLDDEALSNKSRPTEEKLLVNEATGWLCDNWGSGVKSDKGGISEMLAAFAAAGLSSFVGKPGTLMLRELCRIADVPPNDGSDDSSLLKKLCNSVGWKGRKSAGRMAVESASASKLLTDGEIKRLSEKLLKESKEKLAESRLTVPTWMPAERARLEKLIGMPYRAVKDSTFEFAVMLDHALRKISGAHSCIKNAEAERRQFEADSQRLANVPPDALEWLDSYCRGRKETSGAIESYRIRRRAIDGWEKVVQRWSRNDCKTFEDRIKAARELQDDPDIDKFGDIQLFEALAAGDAECVWKRDGNGSEQPLKDFVFATDAMAKRQRFKVPAYRHPDALLHPVFTDFGNSRWDIDFSVHRAPTALCDLAAKVAKLKDVLAATEKKRTTAIEAKRERMDATIAELRTDLENAQRKHAAIADRYRVELRLWNGRVIESTPVRWSCKRLVADLGLNSFVDGPSDMAVAVTRADRLGRAAVGAAETTRVSISGLFQEKDWNGRLQAPRAQLDAIARRVEKHGWDAKAHKMVRQIRWLLSFSAKLTQQGPWIEYCNRFSDEAPARPFVSRQGEYATKHQTNETRKGHGKLILSRLPALRVLAVDLGHRFAAACAVWEAISIEQMQSQCKNAGIKAPSSDAMYVHLKSANSRGKQTTTIYRRIGSDVLPGGSMHPAPWARLDRQFVIKLQGEDRQVRKASPNEIKSVEEFGQWAGLDRGWEGKQRKLRVDALMSDAVRTARLALARHGRRARIANQLIATSRTRPGGVTEPLTEQSRLELFADLLSDWHALATDDRWDDSQTRKLWNDYLAKCVGGFPVQRKERSTEATKAERKNEEDALAARLKPLASLLTIDQNLCRQLHDSWAARWKHDDKEWQTKLKWLSRWLMPRGGKTRGAERRNVGGLSLMRIATLTEFRRKVQVGFFTRMKPDGARVETNRRFGQKTLDRIERLKDNRVKQLASRIVEAALGVGIERHGASGRDMQRPRERIDDPRFAPCHAVVIEDLSHYRPEETRTRRENRATMDWKSAEARKRLEDACQLFGLHLRDVNPQYTSRQDSRTGAPGVRCVEVEVGHFLSSTLWRRQVAQAQRKADDAKGDARDGLLVDLAARHRDSVGSDLEMRLVIPFKGGDLFCSTAVEFGAVRCIQADLNAAANIGLRALMDPDFAGKWWYVPSDPKTNAPKADKVKGGILDGVGSLVPLAASTSEKKKTKGGTKKVREVVNLWRDPSMEPIQGATNGEAWRETSSYWNGVQKRVVDLLRQSENWRSARDLESHF